MSMPQSSRYHYHSPHQMTPLLPAERQLDELRPLAAQVIAEAKDLATQGMPHLRRLLAETLRPMNSFYTNKIEGQHTEPLLIEQALHKDFSAQPDEARKQRVAVAHIQTERWGEGAWTAFDSTRYFAPQVVRDIHRHLHEQLPKEDLVQFSEQGERQTVTPGAWRTAGVQIGTHIPPDPDAIDRFMMVWCDGYRFARAGETALIALMAAHHRLTWIHPFLDGNGRTARLHTHLGLAALGLTQGLWSPMRGLARRQQDYYARLRDADSDRRGDYDGRGVLSEQGLVEFIRFFMDVCLDQVRFMQDMLDMGAFESRLAQMLAAESTREQTRTLKPEAALPLAYLATASSLDRTRFKGMTGLAPRTADRVLADLFKLGIVTSRSPKGPLELALPLHLFRYLFPRLWPEAEVSVRQRAP